MRWWLVAAALAGLALLPTVAAVASTSFAKRSCTGHLHGTLRGGDVSLSGCRTYVVTSTLTIKAKGNVTIAKPLQVASGAGLTIMAGGRIVIKAPIRPEPAKTSARSAQATGCSNPSLRINGTLGVTVNWPVSGAAGGTDANGNGCPGQRIFISATLGGVHINAPVSGGDGGPGRQYRVVQGTNGGCHAPSNRYREADGGFGGSGGSVFITGHSGIAGGAVTGAGQVRAGNGGVGGSVLAAGLDGGDQESGMGAGASSGAGGDGGDAVLFYNRRDHPFGHAGAGGAPGNAIAAAGSGGPPNCDGGTSLVVVGDNGDRGSGSLDPLKKTSWASVRVSGGDGADAIPPPNPLPGGAGGEVDIVGGTPVPGANKNVHAFLQSLLIDGAGDGGRGSNGCPSNPGGNGGQGGTLESVNAKGHGNVLVLSSSPTDRTVRQSFNGGNAGDGMPPGNPGAAGSDRADGSLAIDRSFMPGNPGKPCPVGSTRTATGSLTDNGGGALAYSLQTNQPANAFRLTLPPGNDITGNLFPAGFLCTDNGNQETCKGGSVSPNVPFSGSFLHTATIAANCGCVTIEFSQDGGATWVLLDPGTFLGPAASAPGTGTGGGAQPLSASILNPVGDATFLDGPLSGGTTPGLGFQGQISGGMSPYTPTIDWGDGTTTGGTTATHPYPGTTSLDEGKMSYSLIFNVVDAAGHNVSVTQTITVLCSGISGPGFTADLGAGQAPTIVFCGHWTGGFEPAKVLFMPASGQSWQFSGPFNLFESLGTCPNPTTVLIGSCNPKKKPANPTLHFGAAANIDRPVVAGMKITVEGEDSTGQVVQSMTGTV